MSKPFSSTKLKIAVWSGALVALAAFSLAALPHGASPAKSDSRPAMASTQASAQQRSQVRATLGALPLAFEANEGQSDPQVKYMARGNGYTLFLTSDDAVFSVRSSSQVNNSASKFASARGIHNVAPVEEKTAAIHMQMLGGKANPQIAAGAVVPGVINYYRGSDPSRWIEGVKQYASVNYRDVYPGVNVAYHGEQRQLEFDFIVSPGASTAPIKLGFNGASKVVTDDSGNLILSSDAGDVLLHKPVAYQEKDGRREPVEIAFQPSSGNEVGFTLGSYDHSRELVIDPTLTYATYLGGSSEDEAFAIALDGTGNTYVTGQTDSLSFTGKSAGPSFNVFVTALKSDGTAFLYTDIFAATGGGGNCSATGTGSCSGNAIAVDSTGNAYVAGSATAGFPTLSGFQTAFGGGATDAFVLKLNSAGTLVYSTYLGGSGDDNANAIAIDSSGNAYIAGETDSTNFPTKNPIQSSNASGNDAFVTEIKTGGGSLVYSTYLGGSSGNLATGIALDSSNDAYVTGITVSSDFPTTTGVVQPSFGGGSDDSFVTEVNPGGSAWVYSTYLGGSGADEALGIAVDSEGDAIVTGTTNSTNFPTVDAAQTSNAGGYDVFVTKVNPGGTALLFSTYYGGTLDDVGTGIGLDSFGDAYVTGKTTSSNYPVSNAFQSSLSGTSDALVTEFSNTGFIEYSSFLGGTGTENLLPGGGTNSGVGAVAVDSTSNAYLAGATASTTLFPITGTVPQSNYGGGLNDAFVAKVGPAPADFSVAAAPTGASVSSGSTTSQITVTVSSVNASYGQAVTLSCGSLPTHAACQFVSSSLTPTTTAQTTTLTISTNNAAQANSFSGNARIFAAFLAPIVGIALIGLGSGSRKRRVLGMFVLTLALMALLLLPACGGGSSSGGGGGGGGTTTSPGTYHITISGAAGGVTHSAPFTLTVN